MTKEEVWVKFAAAIISTGGCRDVSSIMAGAAIADRMVHQWDARFGDAAFMLEGQGECANCHSPLPPGSDFTPSCDGVKFCGISCLTASGREE